MKYRFDDIVTIVNEKRKGLPGDEKNYISINDIEPKNLCITKWGSEEPFIGEAIVIRKGDVLFIKRDPSNHQVAISPIDGLFTGFGMALRPKTNIISQEFLPYFIFSESFINKVSSIAVGTKYKVCNLKELRELVFDIPSLNEQSKILNVMKEIDILKDNYNSLLKDLSLSAESYLKKITTDCDSYSLGSLISLQTKTEKFEGLLRSQYVTYDEIANNTLRRQGKNNDFYGYRLERDQFIAQRVNFSKGAVTLITSEYDGKITPATAQVFNVNKRLILPEYLIGIITSPKFTSKLDDKELTTSNWNSYFSQKTIPVPSKEDQIKYLRFCKKVEENKKNTINCLNKTYSMLQSVLCEHITAD